MAHPGYRVRLEALFAPEARQAVILRRGPKRHFHLIQWDLATDSLTPGQWMKGMVRLCDLSPNGRKLIYWATQYHAARSWRPDTVDAPGGFDPLRAGSKRRSLRKGEARRRVPRYRRAEAGDPTKPGGPRPINGVWTALSTPPYFSALAVWGADGHWTGGGLFLSNRAVAIGEPVTALTPKMNAPWPKHVSLTSVAEAYARPDWPAHAAGLERRHGLPAGAPVADALAERRAIADGLRSGGAGWVEFVATGVEEDLLFGCDGKLFRLPDWRATPASKRLAAAHEIADLRGLSFQRLPAPEEALRW
ncbi:MAG: hypothetical protein AAF909_12385 [Pseudomonadota bacterium]